MSDETETRMPPAQIDFSDLIFKGDYSADCFWKARTAEGDWLIIRYDDGMLYLQRVEDGSEAPETYWPSSEIWAMLMIPSKPESRGINRLRTEDMLKAAHASGLMVDMDESQMVVTGVPTARLSITVGQTPHPVDWVTLTAGAMIVLTTAVSEGMGRQAVYALVAIALMVAAALNSSGRRGPLSGSLLAAAMLGLVFNVVTGLL